MFPDPRPPMCDCQNGSSQLAADAGSVSGGKNWKWASGLPFYGWSLALSVVAGWEFAVELLSVTGCGIPLISR